MIAVEEIDAPGGYHGWVGENPDLFARMAQAWFDQDSLPPELIPVRSTVGA